MRSLEFTLVFVCAAYRVMKCWRNVTGNKNRVGREGRKEGREEEESE